MSKFCILVWQPRILHHSGKLTKHTMHTGVASVDVTGMLHNLGTA